VKDADSTPSPKRFCRIFGMRSAARNASAASVLPRKWARERSLIKPAIRLSMIPAATRNAGRPDGDELLACAVWRSNSAPSLETSEASDFATPRIRPKRRSRLRRTRSSDESAFGVWRFDIRRSVRFKVGWKALKFDRLLGQDCGLLWFLF